MKKNLLIYTIALSVVALSCSKDVLNKAPLDKYSDQNVWSDPALTNLFINSIYANMHTVYDDGSGWLMASITDEAEAGRTFVASQKINTGQYSSADGIYSEYYQDGFENIRKCNLLLQNLPKVPASDDIKKRMKGEAFFHRAFASIDIYMRFGRFPIIDKVLSLTDESTISRGADADCIKFILKDLDSAVNLLPVQYTSVDKGRATKGAAYAIKSRLLLNLERYQESSDAAEEVMKLGYSLFNNYQTLFNPENDNNVEIIFDKQYGSEQSAQTHDLDVYENSPYFTGFSSGITCPTQNLVDAFEMKDGLPWNESPLYNAEKPYENKDPRFYATVIYDGMQWMGKTIDMKKGSLFNKSSGSGSAPTNYFMRKFLNPKYDFETGNNPNYQNCPVIRLAEIYLIYAECQFQLGHIDVARTYVNKIRERVNMPDIKADNFIFESIMHEREVELALEGQRWFDIKRWKKGAEFIGADIYGMDITDAGGVRSYNRFLVEKRAFDPKMYLFPIPLSEINKYPSSSPLEQNPGW
jgi:starch-binding outer membrane protein, SusD/RagB family